MVGLEIQQLLTVRKLDLSPEFKRTQAIATAIAWPGSWPRVWLLLARIALTQMPAGMAQT